MCLMRYLLTSHKHGRCRLDQLSAACTKQARLERRVENRLVRIAAPARGDGAVGEHARKLVGAVE